MSLCPDDEWTLKCMTVPRYVAYFLKAKGEGGQGQFKHRIQVSDHIQSYPKRNDLMNYCMEVERAGKTFKVI